MHRVFLFVRKKAQQFAPDLQSYSRSSLLKDVSAGLTVGIIALPLSLALAIATGVPPILGLYTAGVAGFLAALFAGSAYSVSGPAAAMVPILAATISAYGIAKLPYITILAALLLFIFAAMGIGKYIRKIPESVVLGFTCGVAVVIFVGQLNSLLGLSGIKPHESFAAKLAETIRHLPTINFPTIVLGLTTLAIIIFAPRIPLIRKLPPTLTAVVFATLTTLFVPVFQHVATLGSAYGALPLGFPEFNAFHFSPHQLADQTLFVPALKIAGLIGIETLLCAVVADRLTKTRHRPNQELVAQAIGNLGSAFMGGIPATAVIARTGTIVKDGATSRIASLIHAAVVVLFVVALAPLAAAIPLTALSAVLSVTAYKIAELKEVRAFLAAKTPLLGSVLVVTLVLTVFQDLTIGVSAGIVLHLALEAHGKLRGRRGRDGALRLSEEEI